MTEEKLKTFMMLPNDLIFNCLARISRLYYPTLSLVSKRFRSLLLSLELYETRTLLRCTENCLYACLYYPNTPNLRRWFTFSRRQTRNPNPRWFTPCLAPYRFLMNCTRKKEKNLMVSIPTRNCPLVGSIDLATVGSNIYNIRGSKSSSSVLFMDCRSHTWHEAPTMQMPRKFPLVNVLDGRIYVVGGNEDCNSSNLIEFFDPKTQIWEHVPCPVDDTRLDKRDPYASLAIDGNFYLYWENYYVVYKPKENRWDDVEVMDMPLGWLLGCSCVIDNILFTFKWSQRLEWYYFEGRCWRVLKGLKKLPRLPKDFNCVRLTNYGGKMAVLWEKDDDGVVVVHDEKEIWCAEISLKRRNGHEIRGKVEWCNVVLRVPKNCYFLNFCAVTV